MKVLFKIWVEISKSRLYLVLNRCIWLLQGLNMPIFYAYLHLQRLRVRLMGQVIFYNKSTKEKYKGE